MALRTLARVAAAVFSATALPSFQDLHDLGQALLPLLAAVADGLQLGLHDGVEELLDLHVAQTAALIVGLELIEVLVLRQELGEVLGAAESIQIDEHRGCPPPCRDPAPAGGWGRCTWT